MHPLMETQSAALFKDSELGDWVDDLSFQHRVNKIMDMHLKGISIIAIADQMNMLTQDVWADIQRAYRIAKERASLSLQNHLVNECAKLDLIEREAWAAWENSKKTIATGSGGEVVAIPGDHRFLWQVNRVVKDRISLLQLDKVSLGNDTPDITEKSQNVLRSDNQRTSTVMAVLDRARERVHRGDGS